jgi:hypothetical protein
LKLDAHALVFLASGRYFYVPFLRHVAAAAPVRRLHLKVHDEPSYASIEEIDEDVGKVEAVEKFVDAVEEMKKVGEIAKKVVTIVQENQVEKIVAAEAADDTTQTVIVTEISSPTSCEEKKKIEVEKKSSSTTPRSIKSKPLERLPRLSRRTRLPSRKTL